MIASFIEWTTRLNETDLLAFALVTVGVMAAVGIAIALVADLIFKLLGIKAKSVHR